MFSLPALLLIVLLVLTSFGLSGSSIGIYHQFFGVGGSDPRLLLGVPRAIRGDEWYVQTGWTISQVAQGLPAVNAVLPGGMNATVQHDLPSMDWSVIFRPHLLGFFALPLEQAMAIKWWLPAFAMVASCHLFLVTMWPRRPVSAALVSIGFFFSPFFQWWYLPITFWPVAWAFLLMAGTIWLLRSDALLPRVAWPVAVGYVTVTVGMGIYAPFIISTALVAVFFAIGVALTAKSPGAAGWRRLGHQLWPMALAGVLAIGVMITWLATRWDVIERFTGTVYPGARLEATGDASQGEILSILSAAYSPALGDAPYPNALGANSSEASSFLLIGISFVIPLLIAAASSWSRGRRVDWLIVSLTAICLLFVAFMIVPGWDPLAHAILLDRVTTERLRIGLGLLSLVLLAVFGARRDEGSPRGWLIPSLVGTGVTLVVAVTVWWAMRDESAVLEFAGDWRPITVLAALSAVLYLFRLPFLASLAFFVASLLTCAGVNPLYVGMYDLRDTPVGEAVRVTDEAEPGAWVGVGDGNLASSVLVHSGVTAFNGFQSAPPPEMWDQVDPQGEYEREWNRLANVSWVAGVGSPNPTNPLVDQIRMTFDACGSFARDHVTYVLSESALDSPCLTEIRGARSGVVDFVLYRVSR